MIGSIQRLAVEFLREKYAADDVLMSYDPVQAMTIFTARKGATILGIEVLADRDFVEGMR